MQYECFRYVEGLEARRRAPFAALMYARADALWRLALNPQSEDDVRAFLAQWHSLLAAE